MLIRAPVWLNFHRCEKAVNTYLYICPRKIAREEGTKLDSTAEGSTWLCVVRRAHRHSDTLEIILRLSTFKDMNCFLVETNKQTLSKGLHYSASLENGVLFPVKF